MGWFNRQTEVINAEYSKENELIEKEYSVNGWDCKWLGGNMYYIINVQLECCFQLKIEYGAPKSALFKECKENIRFNQMFMKDHLREELREDRLKKLLEKK